MSDEPRWKIELLTRIDAAWCDWLRAVDRVEFERINEPGVAGYWSVKDLTAHLAYWESVVHEHIERGRLDLGPRTIDVDAINQQIYLENHERDFALVRVDLYRAHAATVAAIRALDAEPSEDLARRIGSETWGHYPEHTAQVLAWLDGASATDSMTPAQISAKYARAVEQGLELFARIPEDRRLEGGVCGWWSAKDLLGHLAYWDGVRLGKIEAEMAGAPIPVVELESTSKDPYHRINAEQADIRANWTWEQVMEEATGHRDRLIEALNFQSAYDQSAAGNHWDVHRADLERWLGENGIGTVDANRGQLSPDQIAVKYTTAVDRMLTLVESISPERREEPGACGTWSVKDVLAHLTYWDQNNIGILEAAAAGQPYTLDEGDVDARNLDAVAARSAYTWEELLAEVKATRDRRAELHHHPSEVDFSGSGDHWDEHRVELEAWLGLTLANLTPDQIVEQYARRSGDVIEIVASVPEDRRNDPGVCGEWSLKDLMGHLAYWDSVTIATLEAEQHGRARKPDPRSDDTINAEQAALRAKLSWDEIMTEVHANRNRRIELHATPSKMDMS
ncbi:MAG: ClbS/DfsB family four-helix bundle protein, partial [Chloroflexota bacterium]|nr:ClbS/DfsB family four-helix bundle protein [Chloroflexota bacterium]